jgi:hypothetical protein
LAPCKDQTRRHVTFDRLLPRCRTRARTKHREAKTKKPAEKIQAGFLCCSRSLFELRLFVEHVLASDWIKFFDREFFAHRFFVFGRRVEVAGAS